MKRLATSCLFLLLGFASFSNAQTFRGGISGRIADSSGAVLPGVTVTATNNATGVFVETFQTQLGRTAAGPDVRASVLRRAAASDNPERSAVAEFDQFLSNHPWIAKQLKEGPARANDKDFSSDNRELAQFLNAHPFVQSALRRDPDGFMRRVRNFENYGMFEDDSAMQSDLADLDQFMANHPWIARKLREKPSLANDGDFLNGDPELRDFLNAHPALREAFREHPRAVMNRERAF